MTDEKDVELSADAEVEQEGTPPEETPAAEEVDSAEAGQEEDLSMDMEAEEPPADFDKVVNDDDVPEEDAEAAMLAMLNDLPDEESGASPEDIDFGAAEVSRAEFQQLAQTPTGGKPRNIELLMDVDLPVSIELGRTKMTISDILALGPGSVVELNKLAGEPVDLMVNSKIVARGEVVVVDENFGLRITQLMTPEERLKLLGKE